MRAVLLLTPQGEAKVPVILCAESEQEACAGRLPLFTSIFAQLTHGMDLHPNGSGYLLFENGKPVGMLEIFDAPPGPGKSDGVDGGGLD